MTATQQRLYQLLVRLHPAEFRNDFGRDMQLDFEEASHHTRFAPLYLDALLSLARQWAESAVTGGAARNAATKQSLLTGQYIVFGDQGLSPLEFARGLVAAIAVVAILAAAQRFSPPPPPASVADLASANDAQPTGDDAPNGNPAEISTGPGGRLARLREVASNQRGPSPNPASGLTFSFAARPGAYAQDPHPPTHDQTPQIEVATIKPSDPAKEHLGLYWRHPDGFSLDGLTLRAMIGNAYNVPSSVRALVQGGPAWMMSDAFDVQVKVDPATIARWSKLSQQAVDDERHTVLRELLADRFHLTVHREMREMPAFLLTVAKGGSKLQAPIAEANLQAGVVQSRINLLGSGRWQGHFALLSNLSKSLGSLPETEGRPIVDRTGLTGQYDFTLRWTPADAPTDIASQWPSLFTALEEQLGLKLTQGKAQIESLVIDSVEKPSEN